MVAGAGEVAVVGGAFLRAVGRAHAAVDVEDERGPPSPRLHAVDPLPGEVGQRREVALLGHRARLEAAHLAGGRGVVQHRAAADDPAHRRIMPEPVGIVHVFVARKPAEQGLAELGEQRVTPVLPGARIAEDVADQGREAEGVVEFPEREEPGVRGDGGAMEFELQTTVERDPQPRPIPFTRRVAHPTPSSSAPNPCVSYFILPLAASLRAVIWEMRVQKGELPSTPTSPAPRARLPARRPSVTCRLGPGALSACYGG